MIKVVAYRSGLDISEQADLHDLKSILDDDRCILWLDIRDPSHEDLALLKEQFPFHPLALEDISRPHQRAKLVEYDHSYFLVFYSVQIGERKGILRMAEISAFVGQNYLVTLHRGHVKEIDEAHRRWQGNSESLGHGIGSLVYSLLDSTVDDYFDVVDGIAEHVSRLEERILKGVDREAVQEIFAIKKRLLGFRRVLGPERDAVNTLMRQDLPIFDDRTLVYLRDVYDHLVRITDTVDLYSDLLTSALDVHLTVISNQLNQVMKTLTSATIILMTMALIAGIYGMNFINMPELGWRYGYAWALGLMVVSGVGLYVLLKRKDWL